MFRYLLVLITVFAYSCGQRCTTVCDEQVSEGKPLTKATKEKYIGTGKLIPINTKDENYFHVASYAKDTITPSGWRISYWVKDDSTRYKDLYIKWEKGNVKGIFYDGDVLEMRSYFVPEYIGETPNHLLFWHGCATSCQAILVCNKDKEAKARDIPYVTNYNLPLGQIVYLSEESYLGEYIIVGVVDLLRKKGYGIVFNGTAPYAAKDQAVERVDFSKDKISITALLQNPNNDTETIKVTKVVELE